MGEIGPKRSHLKGLRREAAFPTPRMGLGFLVGAGISLLLLASAADGLLWKHSAERERLRAEAHRTEAELTELRAELHDLRRENAVLRRSLRRGASERASVSGIGDGAAGAPDGARAHFEWPAPRCGEP